MSILSSLAKKALSLLQTPSVFQGSLEVLTPEFDLLFAEADTQEEAKKEIRNNLAFQAVFVSISGMLGGQILALGSVEALVHGDWIEAPPELAKAERLWFRLQFLEIRMEKIRQELTDMPYSHEWEKLNQISNDLADLFWSLEDQHYSARQALK